MRKLLVAVFVALLMAGCGGPDLDDKKTLDGIIAEAIDKDKLQRRSKKGETLYHATSQQTPYTGWAKRMYDNGQISLLVQCTDGKFHGLWTRWYTHGQKRAEETYKDGKLVTTVVWKPNGEKCPVTKVVDGIGVVVFYDEAGMELWRQTYKDGEKDDTKFPD